MLGQNTPARGDEFQLSETSLSRPRFTSIFILDDDSLLNIFRLCRPVLLDEEEVSNKRIWEGGDWGRERWWYKLTHVCQRWRFLILESAAYLGLSLVCTYGTPVPEMLAHSPPLPLTIDRLDKDRNINAEEEEGIMLALRCCNRVRRIRLVMALSNLQKLVMAIDGEFPILEFLLIAPSIDQNAGLTFPYTFQAPSLRHLTADDFALPIGSPLLTTQVGLITLNLNFIHSSAYFSPSDLLERLLHMPQLETFTFYFCEPAPKHDFQQLPTAVLTRITFPNLRWFGFGGYSDYLEEILAHISTPLLKKLDIMYSDRLPFSVPHLGQFLTTTKNLMNNAAELVFQDMAVILRVKPHLAARVHTFRLAIVGRYLDFQAALASQVFNILSPVLSAVTDLLIDWNHTNPSLEWPHEAHPFHWHEILRPFSNVNALFVHSALVGEVSRTLQFDDGEPPVELFPELNELGCYGGDGNSDAFAPFLDARQNDGRPITLV
ncbi:hypothetical protein BC827DRAFT_830658 [Russula dissimulans]|nr:hypothetical protein BC827DRAFT_830658 [Russula dissimulans]